MAATSLILADPGGSRRTGTTFCFSAATVAFRLGPHPPPHLPEEEYSRGQADQ